MRLRSGQTGPRPVDDACTQAERTRGHADLPSYCRPPGFPTEPMDVSRGAANSRKAGRGRLRLQHGIPGRPPCKAAEQRRRRRRGGWAPHKSVVRPELLPQGRHHLQVLCCLACLCTRQCLRRRRPFHRRRRLRGSRGASTTRMQRPQLSKSIHSLPVGSRFDFARPLTAASGSGALGSKQESEQTGGRERSAGRAAGKGQSGSSTAGHTRQA